MFATMNKSLENDHYRALFDYNPNPVYLFDLNGRFLSINKSGQTLLGYSSEQLDELTFDHLIQPKDRERAWESFKKACNGERVSDELSVVRRENQLVDLLITKIPVFDEGEVVSVFVIAQDITYRKRVEATVRVEEKKLRTFIDAMPDFVCFKDGEGKWLEANEYGRKLFEIENVDYREKTDADLAEYTPFYSEALRACVYYDEQAWNAGTTTRCEERIPQRDGTIRIFDTIKVPMFHEDGSRNGLLVIGRDISERVRAELTIEHMAYHDKLTGLPNRTLFQEHLKEALRKRKEIGGNVAVMFLDLDGFKNINDSLGHAMGDALLKRVTERLRTHLLDDATIYRIGGDEFLVVLPHIVASYGAMRVAERMIDLFQEPWNIEGNAMHVTASIGLALAPVNGEDTTTLMRKADMAMYKAKHMGKNRYQVFNETLEHEMITRVSMEAALREANTRNEFELYYQPIIHSNTRELVGAEALIRWNRSDGGMVSPDKFIPLAEETGLIVSIGEWVLRTACRQAKSWITQGLKPIRISVNLSAKQFQEPLFVYKLKNIILDTGVDPNLIGLEITESLIMVDIDYAIHTLKELKSMGVMISIDDFGTGYSSLGYLKKFPVDKLKIDQSFVKDITTNHDDETIVDTIITLAKNLGLSVVAEGVETEKHFLALEEKECAELQGYYFSKPIPSAEFESRFLKNPSRSQ